MKFAFSSRIILAVAFLHFIFLSSVRGSDMLDGEMKNTIGGASISVSTVSPGSRVGQDNLLIRGTIEEAIPGSGSTVTLTQDVGNGKVLASTVSTALNGQTYNGQPEKEGDWAVSLFYPLNKPPSAINFRVCVGNESGSAGNPCSLVPYAGASIANVDIQNTVRVRGVWFHNIRDGNQASFIPDSTLNAMVDWYANGDDSAVFPSGQFPGASQNVDQIYGQCGLANRVQFRRHRIDTVDATAWQPITTDWTVMVTDGVIPTVPNRYRNHANTIDPQRSFLHVYIVNDFLRPDGAHYDVVGIANSLNDNILAIEDAYVNGNGFDGITRLLAHEIGHTQGLEHVVVPCNATVTSNLMCTTIGWGGRSISNAQCAASHAGSGIDDLNN